MAYIAALLDRGDKFRLANYDTASVETAMLNGFARKPDAVLLVSTGQRAASAPKQEELFPVLLRRLAPVKLDGEWFKGSEELARRVILNALENANAEVVHWTAAQFSEWSIKNREARERADRERAEREQAEAARRQTSHGFVYAFHHRYGNTEWMKVGMTGSADEAACWGRIHNYIKSHNLPSDGWSFVGFIACVDPRELEQRLHRRLSAFRIRQGAARELFQCSVEMYAAIIYQERDFIAAHRPDGETGAAVCPRPDSGAIPLTATQGWHFLIGLVKGAVVVPLFILLAALVLTAAFGGAGKGRSRRAGRFVEGTVGAFGFYRLWTWTFSPGSAAKFAGMAVGAGLSALTLSHYYNRTSGDDAAPGVTHVTAAAPAPTISRASPPAAPMAVRPRPPTPYFRPPPPWAVEEPPAFPHGRQGPAVAGGAPRRNVGCGSWPVGSDADRDCLARRFGR
jgi:hypothetical protein